MTNYETGSRTADKFVVRMPEGLRSQVEIEANASDRSMNAVAVRALKEYLSGRLRKKALLDALERATVDESRVNQISLEGKSVNQRQNEPQNIPGIIPANWTDKQVLDFCSVALRHVVVEGDLKFSDITDALQYMADKGEPAFVRAFDLDEHIKLVADARRYRWLRNVAFDTPRQDLALRDRHHNMLIEQDLDAEIDRAMHAYPGELEVEPCES